MPDPAARAHSARVVAAVRQAIVGAGGFLSLERYLARVLYAPGLGESDAAALRGHCAERLADYEVPERFVWSTLPLPRNANGKVMKRVLREQNAATSGEPP